MMMTVIDEHKKTDYHENVIVRFRLSIKCANEKSCTNKHKVKVSVKPFQRLAGFQRAEPFGRCPQTAKPSYFHEITEQGVRNATAFRGEAKESIC